DRPAPRQAKDHDITWSCAVRGGSVGTDLDPREHPRRRRFRRRRRLTPGPGREESDATAPRRLPCPRVACHKSEPRSCVMAKKGKSGRELIRLVSTADTGFFYTTSKNRKRTPDKLVLKKYDPVVRKHVEFKESKI